MNLLRRERPRTGVRPAGLLLWALVVGCGADPEPGRGIPLDVMASALSAYNGLETNGLITNGLETNGLITNGLAINGLTEQGLSRQTFADWFGSNPASYSETVMRYIVGCAVPSGQSLSWIEPTSRQVYTWSGSLGLAPGWASGQPASTAEQQVVSACLAALANKFGVHVQISMLGADARGAPIPLSPGELETYSQREACFFGNLFTGEGVFAGNDHAVLTPPESSVRACGMTSQLHEANTECPPIVHVGSCSTWCTFEPEGQRYLRCNYNGKPFLPITTRLRPEEIYTCGDGTCQLSESCGTGNSYDNCGLDCGPCS